MLSRKANIDLYSIINSKIIYPLYFARKKDNRISILNQFEKNQWLSRDEILSRQFDKFKQIFSYAFHNSPFYQNLYKEAGLLPEDIQSFDDIAKLPIISKTDIQNHLHEMISTSYPVSQRYEDASGGSTGKPTIFYADKQARPKKAAATLMYNSWAGWDIGDKSFYLWGADKEVNQVRAFKEIIVQKFVLRNITLNAFSLSENQMAEFARMLAHEKAPIIIAYSNVAAIFAQYLEKNKIVDIRPKGIICSADTLTEEKRNLIENVFKCPVLNRYGSREVGLIAAECKHQEGLHINAENVLVEFLPVGTATEQMNEIIVTDFHNRAMPIIRYNMQDLGKPLQNKCSCGRGLPLMGTVQGRSSDFIKHQDGNLVHGEYFSHLFYGMKGIKQFQIVQNCIDTLDISVSSSNPLTEEMKTLITSKVYEIMGTGIQVNIHEKDYIQTPASGKFRFAISNI